MGRENKDAMVKRLELFVPAVVLCGKRFPPWSSKKTEYSRTPKFVQGVSRP